MAGWSFAGEVPNVSKAVIVVAPHTSNWDFVVGAAAMLAADLEVRWLGKHTLFEGLLAPLMNGLGGIPVNRSLPGRGVVEDMAALIHAEDQLLLALAPEGTRSRVDRWKTGFHRIARAGGVPIVPVALDYGPREIRFGPVVVPGDDSASDIARLQSFFSSARGKIRETPA
jgi:1-acyl-sn-glycerol-3-phosphate acyltransferase